MDKHLDFWTGETAIEEKPEAPADWWQPVAALVRGSGEDWFPTSPEDSDD